MALPSTGAISFLDIIEEIDRKRTPRAISLNDADVRHLADKPSGAISFGDLRGKEFATRIRYSSNHNQVNLTSAIQSATRDKVEIIIDSGVVLYSDSDYSDALRIDNLFGKTVTIINNGTICGAGGEGGKGGSGRVGAGNWADGGGTGKSGSRAMWIRDSSGTGTIKLKDNGTIVSGGGGGAGGGAIGSYGVGHACGGGGGGGGQGYNNPKGGKGGWVDSDKGTSYEHVGYDGKSGSGSDRGQGGDGGQWNGTRLGSPAHAWAGRGGYGGRFGQRGDRGTTYRQNNLGAYAGSDGGWGGVANEAIHDPDNILVKL